MTKRRVSRQMGAAAAGYVVGIVVLLLWPDRRSADQNAILLAGLTVLILVGVTLEWLIWRPEFNLLAFLTQTGPRRKTRPLRYLAPKAAGLIAAWAIAAWQRGTGAPDWGIVAFAVSVPVLLAGSAVSSLLLAPDAKGSWDDVNRRPGDIPAR
jgi:hypothetical protein